MAASDLAGVLRVYRRAGLPFPVERFPGPVHRDVLRPADASRQISGVGCGTTSYGGSERHMRATMEFVDSLVDAAGVSRSLDHLDLRITVSFSDGKVRVFERTVAIPDEYGWTERM